MSQELIGEKLGSFRLEEVLGSGAMGVVYRATHETSGRPVAVKIVDGELAQKGKVFERFEREAEILKQFRHPSIVRWLAWGRFKGTSYIAMEFVEGVTLERLLQDRGELPWREVVDLTIQLCDALQYAHDMNVVHRDLKPSNLMITLDGKLKLTDFGIAKDLARTTQLTAPGRTLGTAAYMAPEQIRGTPAVSHKTDLYSLGVLMYQMLTGKTPFDGASAVVLMHCHINEPPPRPGDKVAELPKELNELVVKLMAKSPADRPWDAAVVGHALKELRDKAARGEAISMVWPEPGSSQANPPRAGIGGPASRSRRKGGKSGALAGINSGFATRGSDGLGFGSYLPRRGVLEVAGLAAALIVMGGFIGYWLWPPSAPYLYHQAEALMTSSHRSDWLTAQEEYLDTLDRKYPGHPYSEQLTKWRDHIVLDEAEGRARNLSSPVKTSFSEPHTNAERQYVSFDTLATKAIGEGNDALALTYWREMARLINPDDREERKWHLLALERADKLETRIQERRAFVIDQLSRAIAAHQAGRPNESVAIRAMLKEKYSHYADLADLLGPPLETMPGPPPPGALGLPAYPSQTPAPIPQPAPSTSPERTPDPQKTPAKSDDG
jgi:serine/threonine protein kinase